MDQSKDLGTLPGDWNGPSVQSIPDSSACEKESRGQEGGKMISFGFEHSSRQSQKKHPGNGSHSVFPWQADFKMSVRYHKTKGISSLIFD